jgi:hypothetical protein
MYLLLFIFFTFIIPSYKYIKLIKENSKAIYFNNTNLIIKVETYFLNHKYASFT